MDPSYVDTMSVCALVLMHICVCAHCALLCVCACQLTIDRMLTPCLPVHSHVCAFVCVYVVVHMAVHVRPLGDDLCSSPGGRSLGWDGLLPAPAL